MHMTVPSNESGSTKSVWCDIDVITSNESFARRQRRQTKSNGYGKKATIFTILKVLICLAVICFPPLLILVILIVLITDKNSNSMSSEELHFYGGGWIHHHKHHHHHHKH